MDLAAHALVSRLHGIYAIVNDHENVVQLTRALLDGGARIVQYRAKGGIVPERARAMRELTRRADALFLLNDDWRAVAAYDADGVHVGPEDAAPHEMAAIRATLAQRVLGVSCGAEEEARAAEACGADYIGVGCVFPTASKADAGDPIGIPGLVRVASATRLPVAAIGGITSENLRDVRAAGVAMAAVISAISRAADPQAATAELVRMWNASS
jgi:thiamine-phosphate pyrophosphorylase